ncbi:hypothetical protein [Jeotgalibacillus campisalis]|uniref:Uncharacterized protein n=1 Tax=Jeotgalibacillus campisalis TaxID=220754 RepID=A0A0C2SAL1_9BACL|nr:hypothetical protein [Jeotgalibacillus campisalis]KIL50984.1 hypothetical protein KR50_08650 [Jeotgalibacillus campisalis]
MKLIDLYVYEVTRRLPLKIREDIALELHSSIQDMLSEDSTEEEIKEQLTKLGDPAKLAHNFTGRPTFLIGPAFYEHYLSILKLSLIMTLAVVLVTQIIFSLTSISGEIDPGSLLLQTLFNVVGQSFMVGAQLFFWMTIVFAFIEKSGVIPDSSPQSGARSRWSPDDLTHVHTLPKKKRITKSKVIWNLIWTAVLAGLYFNASHLIAVFERVGIGFKSSIPVFNEEVLLYFWPFVILLIAIEAALAVYKWVLGQWTQHLALLNMARNGIFLAFFAAVASRPALFNPAFISYMQEQLGQSHAELIIGLQWLCLTSILTVILYTVINSYEGIKKARLNVTRLLTP